MRKLAAILWITLMVGLVLAPGSARAITVLPDFGAATFVPGAPIDNLYFPLTDNLTRVFAGGTERFEFTNLGAGPTILGVQTTTRRDRAFVDGVLMEDTFDYFAQDTVGNVWYLGEDVTNYIYDDMGNLTGTNSDSTWRAGVNSALPGFIMPADLTVGFNYYQEFAAADAALDQATTNAVGQKFKIDIGKFKNVVRVLETTELDADFREFKYYAPGQGLIYVEEGLDADLMSPELTLELVSIGGEDEIDDDDMDDDDMDDDDMNDHDMDDDVDEGHGRERGQHERGSTNHVDDGSDENEERDDDERENMDDIDIDENRDDETDDDDDGMPSEFAASRFNQSLLSLGHLASAQDSSLDPAHTIVRLVEGEDSGGGAAAGDSEVGLLAAATALDSSEAESTAAMLPTGGQAAIGAELADSSVPEPSAWLLAALGLLAVRRMRRR